MARTTVPSFTWKMRCRRFSRAHERLSARSSDDARVMSTVSWRDRTVKAAGVERKEGRLGHWPRDIMVSDVRGRRMGRMGRMWPKTDAGR